MRFNCISRKPVYTVLGSSGHTWAPGLFTVKAQLVRHLLILLQYQAVHLKIPLKWAVELYSNHRLKFFWGNFCFWVSSCLFWLIIAFPKFFWFFRNFFMNFLISFIFSNALTIFGQYHNFQNFLSIFFTIFHDFFEAVSADLIVLFYIWPTPIHRARCKTLLTSTENIHIYNSNIYKYRWYSNYYNTTILISYYKDI